MPSESTARRVRGALAVTLLLLALAYATRAQIYDIASGSSGQVGSWLINYGGGFVRRGLFGQLFLWLTPHGSSALWMLLTIQLGCYLLVLGVFLRYLHANDYSWTSIALACGPAALPFIAWDWQGGFRPELLVFTALSLLVLANDATPNPWRANALTYAALAVFTMAVFTWEPSLLSAPAMIYLLLRMRPIQRGRLGDSPEVLIVALVAVSGLVASVAARGDATTIAGVYAALESEGLLSPAFNGSAVESLAWTNETVRQLLQRAFPAAWAFVPLGTLALLPVITNPWSSRNCKWALACAVGILPLFFVAVDYGRFIHLLVMELSLCIVATGRTPDGGLQWRALPTVLYISVWGVPYLDPLAGPYPGWFGGISTLVRAATGQ